MDILGGHIYIGDLYSLQDGLTEQSLERLQFDLCLIDADTITSPQKVLF